MGIIYNTEAIIKEWANLKINMNTITKSDEFDTTSIEKLKIQENSFLGQIVGRFSEVHTCNGFFTLLCGAGQNSIIKLNQVNNYGLPELFQKALIIAYDKCGNIFAINAGVDNNFLNGNILYLPTDCLIWEDLEIRYSDFLMWVFTISNEELEAESWKSGNFIKSKGKIIDYIIGKAATYNYLKNRKCEEDGK